MLPQLRLLVCPAKESCCKRHCSPGAPARLTCTHEWAGTAKHHSGEEMRRVLLLVATALAFTQNRRRPRGRRRDVLRHAGADDEFVRNAWATCKANLPAIVTGAWDESAGDDEPGGALANLALVRAYQCAFLPSTLRDAAIRHRRDAQNATRRHTAPRAPGLLHAVPRARRVAADRRLRLRRRAPGNSAGRRLDDLRVAAPADLVMCLLMYTT